MQQGRVQLDADWNEQVDIAAYLDETTRVDVIGRCGIPVNAAGFEVGPTPDGLDLALSPGRAYVDGILCELDATPIDALAFEASAVDVERVVADGRELADGDVVELSATGVAPIVRLLAGVDVKASARRARHRSVGIGASRALRCRRRVAPPRHDVSHAAPLPRRAAGA